MSLSHSLVTLACCWCCSRVKLWCVCDHIVMRFVLCCWHCQTECRSLTQQCSHFAYSITAMLSYFDLLTWYRCQHADWMFRIFGVMADIRRLLDSRRFKLEQIRFTQRCNEARVHVVNLRRTNAVPNVSCLSTLGAEAVAAAMQSININNYKYHEFGKLKNENFKRHRNNDDSGIYNILKLSPNNSHTMEIRFFSLFLSLFNLRALFWRSCTKDRHKGRIFWYFHGKARKARTVAAPFGEGA